MYNSVPEFGCLELSLDKDFGCLVGATLKREGGREGGRAIGRGVSDRRKKLRTRISVSGITKLIWALHSLNSDSHAN